MYNAIRNVPGVIPQTGAGNTDSHCARWYEMLSKYRLPVLIEHRHCKCSGVYHDLAILKARETMGVKSEKTLTLVDSVIQRRKRYA